MLKESVFAVTLAMASLQLVQAQVAATPTPPPTAEAEATLQRVTVTGSNIKRINAETASPIQIITKEELTRGGATSLNEVLRTIAVNQGGQSDTRTGGFSSGAAGLNLRGIGSQATLVLINGRRLAPYAQPEFQTTFVDLNSVPIGAVERIEILKDGASAIYGSEAMAGVVNIIMKNSFEGVELGGSIAQSEYGDGEQTRATISGGRGNLIKDHFNAYATLDIRQRKPQFLSNRPDYIGTQNWEQWGYADKRNLYTSPGNLYWTDPATGKFTSRTLDKNCPADRLVPAAVFFGAGTTGTACVFDDLKDGSYNSAGKTDRIGLTSRATWQLNEDLTVFAEAMYNQNKSYLTGNLHWVAGQNGQIVPALPITHPQYPSELIDPVTGLTLAGGNKSVRVRAQLADLPGQGQENTTDFGRYLLGAKGTLKNWDWESALLINTSKVNSANTNGLLTTPFIDAYRNGTFIFGAGPNELYQTLVTPSSSGYESGMKVLDAKVSGELMNLPAGPLAVASGIEFRNESLKTSPDPLAVAGELYHQAQMSPGFENSRNVKSIYGELSIPVLKDLEAQLAIRHDRYSDYGSSTTPKVGAKWNANSSLLFRGTYSTGFRAPTLVENSTDMKNAFVSFRDPERCNDTFKVDCTAQSPYQSGANPKLQPETARSMTLGVVWEPTTWLNVSVDAWRIARDNEVGSYDLATVLSNPARYAGDPAITITRDPLTPEDQAAGATAGEVTNIKSLLTNISITDVRGLDFDIRGKFNLGEYGKLEPRLNLTYTDSYKTAPSPGAELVEFAGSRGQPKVQATLGVSWKKAAWSLSADAVYIGTMSSQGDFTQPCDLAEEGYPELCNGIASFTTVNLGGRYTGYKDLTLSFALQNAFNRMPPFAPVNGLGFYYPLHSVTGRYIQLSVDYKFK